MQCWQSDGTAFFGVTLPVEFAFVSALEAVQLIFSARVSREIRKSSLEKGSRVVLQSGSGAAEKGRRTCHHDRERVLMGCGPAKRYAKLLNQRLSHSLIRHDRCGVPRHRPCGRRIRRDGRTCRVRHVLEKDKGEGRDIARR